MSEAVKLAIREYSKKGTPLLVLHGLFGSQSNWGWHIKQLADSFHVIGIDLRNHGDSPHVEQHDYRVMARDVAALIEDAGLEGCYLMGHSMGGKVAMQLALSQPELVARLLVVDIAPVEYSAGAEGHANVFAGMNALDLANLESRKQAEELIAEYIEDPDTRKFVLTNLVRSPEGGYRWKLNLSAIEACYDKLRAGVDGEPFAKPTLFVKGDLSPYVQRKHEAEILRLFPNAGVKIIMEAGHWLHADKPQAFQKIAQDFFGAE